MSRRSNKLPSHLRIEPPRELCRTCREWLSIKDIELDDLDDIPHCIQAHNVACTFYMNGSCNECPQYNQY